MDTWFGGVTVEISPLHSKPLNEHRLVSLTMCGHVRGVPRSCTMDRYVRLYVVALSLSSLSDFRLPPISEPGIRRSKAGCVSLQNGRRLRRRRRTQGHRRGYGGYRSHHGAEGTGDRGRAEPDR
jgi:hypothetical protein